MIPVIETHARISFRHLDRDAYEEAIQEAICNACQAYARLVEQGKADVVRASMLADFAVRQVREGRRVGGSLNIHDVTSSYCQKRKNIVLEQLDRHDSETDTWAEVLVEDRSAGPADTAAMRIDFAEWIKTLKPRIRKIARYLSLGNKPSDAAEKYNISRCRISLLRRELFESWHAFQGNDLTWDVA